MQQLTDTIRPIFLKYGVKKASLFGSYARGTYDNSSDIDILFQPPRDMGISYIELKHELEDTLQKKVDLVSMNGINKYLKEDIMSSLKPLL